MLYYFEYKIKFSSCYVVIFSDIIKSIIKFINELFFAFNCLNYY